MVRSFISSSVLWPLSLSSERSRNVEKYISNFNLEVPISCSEKSIAITKSFGNSSEMISYIVDQRYHPFLTQKRKI